MQYLVVTDSVHATAAACDYLEARLETDDTVTVVALAGEDTRDAGDALNVANARLIGVASVETERISDDDGIERLLELADGADSVVLGRHLGVTDPDRSLGSAAETVAGRATVPVVVVPADSEA
jgi:nucleotide-binding universal stress UspA family protein